MMGVEGVGEMRVEFVYLELGERVWGCEYMEGVGLNGDIEWVDRSGSVVHDVWWRL